MTLIQVINICLAIKSSVHNQFDLVIPKEIDIRQEVLDRFYVGDVTCQLAIIKRQVGLLLIYKLYGLVFTDYFGTILRCSHTLRLMNFGADLFGPKLFQKKLFLSRGGISGRLQYSMSSYA